MIRQILELLLSFWIYWFWVLVAPIDLYLTMFHLRRLERGKIRRYIRRRYGLFGVERIRVILLAFLGCGFPFLFLGKPVIAGIICSSHWTIIVCADVIDYITGGDDPGRRIKKLVSSLVKKLKIAPAPRPAYR